MNEELNFEQLYKKMLPKYQKLVKEKISGLEESMSELFIQCEEEIKNKSYGLAMQKLTIDYGDIIKEMTYWGEGKVDLSDFEKRKRELSKKLNGKITGKND